jgi:hypothetical protein
MDSTALAQQPEKLPLLIEQAAAALAKATTAAEFLEAHDQAAFVYDAAKMAARFAKAKQAHDTIIAACRKAQADALLIEARAQMRLAEEYDAAQARGELAKHSGGNPQIVPNKNDLPKTAAELGLDRKEIHEARRVRDAEKAKPGIVEQTLAAAGEPTRARLKRAVDEVLEPPPRPAVQGEAVTKTVARKEARQQELDKPNKHEAHDASQLSIHDTDDTVEIWLIGFIEGAEAIAEQLEAALRAETQRDTPESKIRAAAFAEAVAVARKLEAQQWDYIRGR